MKWHVVSQAVLICWFAHHRIWRNWTLSWH